MRMPLPNALLDADVDDDALVGVEVAVVDQALLERASTLPGRRHPIDDGGNDIIDSQGPVLPLARRTSSRFDGASTEFISAMTFRAGRCSCRSC